MSDNEGYSAFDEWRLNKFDEGKLERHQIDMMLINAIQRLEKRIDFIIKKYKI